MGERREEEGGEKEKNRGKKEKTKTKTNKRWKNERKKGKEPLIPIRNCGGCSFFLPTCFERFLLNRVGFRTSCGSTSPFSVHMFPCFDHNVFPPDCFRREKCCSSRKTFNLYMHASLTFFVRQVGCLATCWMRSLESYPAHHVINWCLRQGCIRPQF